jgi:hypothetical protein
MPRVRAGFGRDGRSVFFRAQGPLMTFLCRKARGSSPRRIEGRDNSDWHRLHQLHGSQYVDCRRNARRNKLSWNPGVLHSDLGPGRALHVLPRHVAATDMDRRQVCVRPPQLAASSFSDLKDGPSPRGISERDSDCKTVREIPRSSAGTDVY